MLCLPNWKYIFLIFMVFELIIITVHMFSDGFLLSRDVLTNKSKCADFQISCTNKLKKNCHLPKKFNKTVLLIIDALRYDFVTYDSSVKKKEEKPFQNKIKIFNELLSSNPKQSKLLKFIADPPTTTLQRLKGLTTGSLPTFIDASHNFASTEIIEDNIIDQMSQAGMKIIALGDDTWGELYPNRFRRSFLFPSFNVMDLDTVDNGILNHLFDEIRSSDWDFIVAHFLGVDHCGHRYGPSHPQMAVKLRQMNEVIKNVSRMLEKDSLMVVIGDHGMTSTGDHGGDSREEIETTLFFYSPGLSLPSPVSKYSQSVAQIDLVPTLASVMGVPIPYSNLGKVIEDIVDASETCNCSIHDVLYMNYQQINRYLNSYREVNNEFPENSWQHLKTISYSLSEGKLNTKQKQQMIQFLNLARAMCEEIWAKFNILNIIFGLISLACILLSIISILPKNNPVPQSILHSFRHVFVLFLFVNTVYGASLLFSQKGLNFIVCLSFVGFSILFFKNILPYGWNLLSVVTLLLMSLGSFSNSFVVVEDVTCAFIFLSLLGFMIGSFFLKKLTLHVKSKPQRPIASFTSYDLLSLFCVVAIFFCVRSSRVFLKCREEQHWCDSSSLVHVPLSGLPREFHNTRYFTSLFSLLTFILVPQRWLQRCGNLNGWEIGVVVTKTFPVLCGLLTGGFWALQSVPSIPGNISKVAVHLPQLVYLIMGLGIFAICYNPLLVYILPSSLSNNVLGSVETPVIPQLFMKLKQTYEHRSTKPRKTPVVYGLATAVSSPMIVFLSLVALSVVIIAGDGMTPGILLLIITGVLSTIFHSFLTWNNADSVETLLAPNWCSIAMWFLLSIHGFYTTGHQATFPTLNWSAAFVGYDGTGSYVIPALLVIINTFSSQLLFGMALPLLLIVPLSAGFLWSPMKFSKIKGEAGNRGEFLLVERPKEAKESLLSIGIIYIVFHSFKVLFTSVSAFILRRHLMVWKIFAPHFIFEAVGLIVSCVGVLVGMLFIFRVLSALESWSKKL